MCCAETSFLESQEKTAKVIGKENIVVQSVIKKQEDKGEIEMNSQKQKVLQIENDTLKVKAKALKDQNELLQAEIGLLRDKLAQRDVEVKVAIKALKKAVGGCGDVDEKVKKLTLEALQEMLEEIDTQPQ